MLVTVLVTAQDDQLALYNLCHYFMCHDVDISGALMDTVSLQYSLEDYKLS